MPNLYFQESRSASLVLEILLTLCSNYIPAQVVYDSMVKLRFFAIHKTKYMDKLYSFCNQLVESYCNDAAIQPFTNSTSPSINIQDEQQNELEQSPTPPYHGKPTDPSPSIPKILNRFKSGSRQSTKKQKV